MDVTGKLKNRSDFSHLYLSTTPAMRKLETTPYLALGEQKIEPQTIEEIKEFDDIVIITAGDKPYQYTPDLTYALGVLCSFWEGKEPTETVTVELGHFCDLLNGRNKRSKVRKARKEEVKEELRMWRTATIEINASFIRQKLLQSENEDARKRGEMILEDSIEGALISNTVTTINGIDYIHFNEQPPIVRYSLDSKYYIKVPTSYGDASTIQTVDGSLIPSGSHNNATTRSILLYFITNIIKPLDKMKTKNKTVPYREVCYDTIAEELSKRGIVTPPKNKRNRFVTATNNALETLKTKGAISDYEIIKKGKNSSYKVRLFQKSDC